MALFRQTTLPLLPTHIIATVVLLDSLHFYKKGTNCQEYKVLFVRIVRIIIRIINPTVSLIEKYGLSGILSIFLLSPIGFKFVYTYQFDLETE